MPYSGYEYVQDKCVVVFDMDDVLLKSNFEEQTIEVPSIWYYILSELMEMDNVHVILWTRGDFRYCISCLTCTGLQIYFERIYTRDDDTTMVYGVAKSLKRLKHLYLNSYFVLVDDTPSNGDSEEYDLIIAPSKEKFEPYKVVGELKNFLIEKRLIKKSKN